MLSLQNVSQTIHIDPDKGSFTLQPNDHRFPRLEGIRLDCQYRIGNRRFQAIPGAWNPESLHREVKESIAHGSIETLCFNLPEDQNGIKLSIQFGIPREYPLILWKVGVSNQGRESVNINKIELINLNGAAGGQGIYPAAKTLKDLGFFSNGWQSWSPTGWYRGDSRMKISRLGGLQHPMIYNPGTPLPRENGIFSSDMFAVIGDQVARTGFVIGFLSQRLHFGSILADLKGGNLRMWANGDDVLLSTGSSMETDWAVFTPVLLDHRAPMEAYLEAVARENQARVPQQTPSGWCSWYHYYTRITAQDIESNLSAITGVQERLPLELVQIDDGFETQVGDWFSIKPAFPHGLSGLAEKIKHEGYIPGLWLAPFIVHPGSRLYKEHPEWLLRGKSGKPVNAGFVWNRLDTALDLTVPDALDYACRVVQTAVHKWGFPYLKLDFLYAAALKGCYHDPTKTRAQVLRIGMEALRRSVGDEATLLGCGAPLGSMIGLVDAMRIGPDVSGDWAPTFQGINAIFKPEPSMPSARNSIRSIITRSNLHRKWWVNDPDCLLVRPDTRLTLTEIQSLATVIGMTGGSMLLSDDLAVLPPERMRIAEILLPIINEESRVLDWFDSAMPGRIRLDLVNPCGEWQVLAGFNWTDNPSDVLVHLADYHLDDHEYYFREFWSGESGSWDGKNPLCFEAVPPHGCVLLALKPKTESPHYLGSDLHFTQGIELVDWQVGEDALRFTLRLPRSTKGSVILALPRGASEVRVNNQLVELSHIKKDLYSLPLVVDGFCLVEIQV